MNEVRRKLHKQRDILNQTLREADGNFEVASTTTDFLGLSSRSPWEKCSKTSIAKLVPGINRGVFIDVVVTIEPAIMVGVMTCVQDSSGFVELSLYNWLPRTYIKSLSDLDWAMPLGARIRIREPYLKCSAPNPMAIFTGCFVQNIFIRVDDPDDIKFHPNQPTPDFADRFKNNVSAILSPQTTRSPPTGFERCFANFLANVEVRPSATGEGLFATKHIKKDEIVLTEKAIVAAESRYGFAFQSDKREYQDINTYALYEELAFLNRCSSGEIYLRVVSHLFPANINPESKSTLLSIHEVVQSNTFSGRTHDEFIKASTKPPSPGEEPKKGGRSGLWNLTSKMNHDCAPNTYSSIVDDVMYVFARQDIPAGAELLTRYFDIGVEFPRKFGLRGEERFFKCNCATCVEWQGRRNKSDIEAILAAPSVAQIEKICHMRHIDLENGLSKQDVYILRAPIFQVAQDLMLKNPQRAMKLLYNLLVALRKFDGEMAMAIQVHLAITETAMILFQMKLAKTNLKEAFDMYRRCFKGSKDQFKIRFPYIDSYPKYVLP
ncbi:hypothetical protein BCR41DRAFT_349545 [Lobosporangium transversale]|uniref:SET domain-containing protein n=1 Tax=Lobosporangium transversale TaxID=64571 RepID=A0A1Y2GUK4_9FUNG|nr:hypothetical protein BCR41DRAFT_349545 [Lobosporangium transversale]ORZ22715.1 hypothetical protein BCR41DRAFT_349545 [Lobosporangium transversale]|eukprot:XP_021883269.1 hypothetical protein BCR41DRAFT_349545 [Lobosporangium transversale]